MSEPDPDLLHLAYSALLTVLPLRERERQVHLDCRGLPPDELDEHIERRRYRSLPRIGRTEFARGVLDLGLPRQELLQVPGFAEMRNRQGAYMTLTGPEADALVVPVEDVAGRVVALRLRVVRATGEKLYMYFRGAHARVHVACPRVLTDPGNILVTEGEIKANVSADRLGMVCLSQPGAGACIAETVEVAKTFGERIVIMAYDPDKRDPRKPLVRRGEHQTARALRDAGLEVMEAAWPAEWGKIDDVLVAGHKPEVRPYPFPESRVEVISRERLDSMLPPEPTTMSIAEARYELGTEFRRVVEAGTPGQTAIVGPPGLGKSVTVCLVLQDLCMSGALGDRRILYLLDTHEQIAGLLGNPLLADLAAHAAVWEGRNPSPRSAAYCPDKDPEKGKNLSSRLADRRHGIMGSLCRAKHPEWACEFTHSCPYLANINRLTKTLVVFAPKALFTASPEELGKFDVVIVDEDLAGAMFEQAVVNRAAVDDWSAGVDRLDAEAREATQCPQLFGGANAGPENGEWVPDKRVARWLTHLRMVLLTSLPRDAEAWIPFMPVLRRVAADRGDDLREIVGAVAALPVDRLRRLPFERPFVEGDSRTIPLRVHVELLAAVQREIDWPDDADSTVRLTREGLVLLAVRERHVGLLRERTVVNLDATPCEPLLELMFPGVRTLSLAVRQHLAVTQATNALYTKDYIHSNRWWIDQFLERMTVNERQPAIFTFDSLDPDSGLQQARRGVKGAVRAWRKERQERIEAGEAIHVTNPSALYGHYQGSTRGIDKYREVSLLVGLGDYVESIGSVEAKVRSVRATFGVPRPPQRLEGDVLLPYRWCDDDGSGRGRRFRRHPDPDVAALIEWSRTSGIVQAIGRGRAALRTPEDPLRALLLASWPGHDLPVARLLDLAELKEMAGVPVEDEADDPLDEENRARADKFRRQVFRAMARLMDEGRDVTVTAIARELGVGEGGRQLSTIAKLLARLDVRLRRGTVSQRSSIYTEDPRETVPRHGGSTVHDQSSGDQPAPEFTDNADSTSSSPASTGPSAADQDSEGSVVGSVSMESSAPSPQPAPSDALDGSTSEAGGVMPPLAERLRCEPPLPRSEEEFQAWWIDLRAELYEAAGRHMDDGLGLREADMAACSEMLAGLDEDGRGKLFMWLFCRRNNLAVDSEGPASREAG